MNDEQMNQKKLIYKLNREQTSISRAIKKLFESGLVKKEQSKFDMRSSVLKPTDKGLEIIKQSQEIKMKVVRNFMKELSTEESEQLIMLLRKIYDSFALRDPFRF